MFQGAKCLGHDCNRTLARRTHQGGEWPPYSILTTQIMFAMRDRRSGSRGRSARGETVRYGMIAAVRSQDCPEQVENPGTLRVGASQNQVRNGYGNENPRTILIVGGNLVSRRR